MCMYLITDLFLKIDNKSYVIGKDIISFGFLLFMKMKASDEQRAIKGNNSSHKK